MPPRYPGGGLQSTLTEATFQPYLRGYVEATPDDLLAATGGRVRYAIDKLNPSTGRRMSTQYRLGGWLQKVDKEVYPPRYFRLFNPYVRGPGGAWSVQLANENERVRLWYLAPATVDEIATMRELLQKLENGEIRITRVP